MSLSAKDRDVADIDRRLIAATLAFGRRGLGRTAPNPSVGAILVRDGRVVGRGCTGVGGRPHAERIALEQAGPEARGATLYVTLEPCSHHGRTPPCCEAIVAAGVTRVVYATGDPNPLVAGRGAAFCRSHGLAVTNLDLPQARHDHGGHLARMRAHRPFVTLKLAETADGYAAGGPHDPRLAITGAAANGFVHIQRSLHDAIMVGIGTVRADDPLMTVRLPGVEVRPLRIVLDAELSIAQQARLLQTATMAPVLILASEPAAAIRAAALTDLGVEVAPVATTAGGRIDLGAALAHLADRGVTRIWSEGGPTIAAALIGAGLADDVVVITAPRPLGGDGVPALSSSARERLATDYMVAEERQLGPDRLRRWERIAGCSQA